MINFDDKVSCTLLVCPDPFIIEGPGIRHRPATEADLRAAGWVPVEELHAAVAEAMAVVGERNELLNERERSIHDLQSRLAAVETVVAAAERYEEAYGGHFNTDIAHELCKSVRAYRALPKSEGRQAEPARVVGGDSNIHAANRRVVALEHAMNALEAENAELRKERDEARQERDSFESILDDIHEIVWTDKNRIKYDGIIGAIGDLRAARDSERERADRLQTERDEWAEIIRGAGYAYETDTVWHADTCGLHAMAEELKAKEEANENLRQKLEVAERERDEQRRNASDLFDEVQRMKRELSTALSDLEKLRTVARPIVDELNRMEPSHRAADDACPWAIAMPLSVWRRLRDALDGGGGT